MTNFIVGMLSSLAASLVVVVGVSAGPGLLRRFASDDVDLSGQWLARLSKSQSQYTYSLMLKPFWTGWRGEATITRTSATGDYEHKLAVAARKRGSFVVLTLLGTKGHPGSLATGLFRLTDRGATMDGAWVFRPSESEVPNAEPLTFRRS